MKTNTTLKEIGTALQDAQSVLLFPHINPDADAIGSCVALCRYLRGQGKTAWVLTENKMPDYIAFLVEDPDFGMLVTEDLEIVAEPDVCMCVDCCDEKRFPLRTETFLSGKKKLCIDHHKIDACSWDLYYIDPDAAAVAQIIYQLMTEMDWEIDPAIGEALYTGIAGDTGCFQHSNTTPQVHRIAADLMELGADISPINVKLFQSVDPRDMAIRIRALQSMEMLADGRAAIARIYARDLEETGARLEDSDTVIDQLRNIEGVEMAAFVKQDGELVRVSLRSKTTGNVGAIAKHFGGGGHQKAAGFKVRQPLDEVYEALKAELVKAFDER